MLWVTYTKKLFTNLIQMQPKSSDFVYKNRDCLTLIVRQPLV